MIRRLRHYSQITEIIFNLDILIRRLRHYSQITEIIFILDILIMRLRPYLKITEIIFHFRHIDKEAQTLLTDYRDNIPF